MSFVGILIATGIIGVVGLLIGLFLGIAGIKFKVDTILYKTIKLIFEENELKLVNILLTNLVRK